MYNKRDKVKEENEINKQVDKQIDNETLKKSMKEKQLFGEQLQNLSIYLNSNERILSDLTKNTVENEMPVYGAGFQNPIGTPSTFTYRQKKTENFAASQEWVSKEEINVSDVIAQKNMKAAITNWNTILGIIRTENREFDQGIKDIKNKFQALISSFKMQFEQARVLDQVMKRKKNLDALVENKKNKILQEWFQQESNIREKKVYSKECMESQLNKVREEYMREIFDDVEFTEWMDEKVKQYKADPSSSEMVKILDKMKSINFTY